MTGYVGGGALHDYAAKRAQGNPGCPGWCSAPSASPPLLLLANCFQRGSAWQGQRLILLAIIQRHPGAFLKGALFHLSLFVRPAPCAHPSRKIPYSGRLLCCFCPVRLVAFVDIQHDCCCNMKSITWLAVVPELPVRVSKVWFISTIS